GQVGVAPRFAHGDVRPPEPHALERPRALARLGTGERAERRAELELCNSLLTGPELELAPERMWLHPLQLGPDHVTDALHRAPPGCPRAAPTAWHGWRAARSRRLRPARPRRRAADNSAGSSPATRPPAAASGCVDPRSGRGARARRTRRPLAGSSSPATAGAACC